MTHKCTTTRLEDKDGKLALLDKSRGGGVKLVAEHVQNAVGRKNLEIWKRSNEFALCFKKGKETYFVILSNSNLNLEKTSDAAHDISKANIVWFQKEDANASNYYFIKTVSHQYLTIKEDTVNQGDYFFALSDKISAYTFTTPQHQCSKEDCTGM